MLFIHFLIVSHLLLLKRWVVLLLNDHWFIVVVIRIVRSQGCCRSHVLSSIPSWPQGSLILWLGQASLAPHTGLRVQRTSEACFDAGQRITFHWERIDTCHITAWPTMSKNKAVNWEITGLDSLPSQDYCNHHSEPCTVMRERPECCDDHNTAANPHSG